jgi:hypothetical protein
MQMTLVNYKKTKKKFYNNYIYKVSLIIDGSGALRYYSFPELLDLLVHQDKISENSRGYRENIKIKFVSKANIWFAMLNTLMSFEGKYSKRMEGDILDIYTNEESLYSSLCKQFPDQIRIRFQPEKGMEQILLDSEKQIFVSDIPHGIYNYKVFLTPFKVTGDRKKLCDWMETQIPKITFTPSVKKWCLQNNSNWDRRYIYVDTEATLLMLRLRSSDMIGQVHKFIKSDK